MMVVSDVLGRTCREKDVFVLQRAVPLTYEGMKALLGVQPAHAWLGIVCTQAKLVERHRPIQLSKACPSMVQLSFPMVRGPYESFTSSPSSITAPFCKYLQK